MTNAKPIEPEDGTPVIHELRGGYNVEEKPEGIPTDGDIHQPNGTFSASEATGEQRPKKHDD